MKNSFTRLSFIASIPLVIISWWWIGGRLLSLGFGGGKGPIFTVMSILSIVAGLVCFFKLLPFATGKNQSSNNRLAFLTLLFLLMLPLTLGFIAFQINWN